MNQPIRKCVYINLKSRHRFFGLTSYWISTDYMNTYVTALQAEPLIFDPVIT